MEEGVLPMYVQYKMILYTRSSNGMSHQPFIEDRKRDISWLVMDDYEPKFESLVGEIWENARKNFFFSLRIYLNNILILEAHTTFFFLADWSVCVCVCFEF
jgi:hypothetical protein